LCHGEDHRIVLSVGVNDSTLTDDDRVGVPSDQTIAGVRERSLREHADEVLD
jgi:hypothetical protein